MVCFYYFYCGTAVGTKRKYCSVDCAVAVKNRGRTEKIFLRSTNLVEVEILGSDRFCSFRSTCTNGHTIVRQIKNIRVQKNASYRFNCRCDGRSEQSREATNMKRCNVRNVMQHPDIRGKCIQSSFAPKGFVWPSGRKTTYQGYENWLYEVLL